MKIVLIAVGVVAALAIGFVVWRLIATFQATKRRDRMIFSKVAPLIEQVESGKEPDRAEIARLAEQASTRRALYAALEGLGREDLFPEQYMTKQAAAESDLTYWLLHPNELDSVPDGLELMTTVNREHEGRRLEYLVFRYRMLEPHWAAADGWMVGISGPYLEDSPLYNWAPGTFSTFEKYDSKTPDEHVDWLHETMIKKRAYDKLLQDKT
jgi:hypothetical protein